MSVYIKEEDRRPITKAMIRENEQMKLLCFDQKSALSFFVGVFTWKITKGGEFIAGGVKLDAGIETYNRLAKL